MRIYTDGSLMDPKEGALAGIFSNLFLQYLALGHGSTAFEAELCAIANAMKQMIYRPNINKKKIVVLVDSIQAINNFKKTNETIEEIKSAYQILTAQGNYVILQWIPSHVGLPGNEQADYLAKKGTAINQKPKQQLNLDRRLKEIKQYSSQKELEQRLKGKRYENMNKKVKNEVIQSRKSSKPIFRLETSHDCLNKHLNRIGISSSDKCTSCNSNDIMDGDHLLCCRRLGPEKQRRDLPGLYWEARGLTM
jgi:ribonuclease HI